VDWDELAHDGVKGRGSVVGGFHKCGEIFSVAYKLSVSETGL